MSTTTLLSVVIPAYNEDAYLATLIGEVVRALRFYDHEVIVVDDGSTDRTWAVIAAVKTEHPQVAGVRLTRNFGHQAALLAGLLVARGDAVITMDADGQHPPEVLPRFVEEWRRGFAVVQGVRTSTADEGFLKRVTSRTFYRLFTALGGPHIPTGAAEFRLISRPVLQAVIDSVGPLLFLRGLIPWLGYPMAQVPFDAPARHGGVTAYTWWRMLQLSMHGLLSFTIVPLRLAMLLGGTMAVFSLLYLLWAIVAWMTHRAVPGWTSLMGLVALLGGIQLVTIGVLGEYLGRVFIAQLHRPHFVVRERL